MYKINQNLKRDILGMYLMGEKQHWLSPKIRQHLEVDIVGIEVLVGRKATPIVTKNETKPEGRYKVGIDNLWEKQHGLSPKMRQNLKVDAKALARTLALKNLYFATLPQCFKNACLKHHNEINDSETCFLLKTKHDIN